MATTQSKSQPLLYHSGFGNEFASEAVPGALPVGQNSPQKAPHGLYAEQLSGTPFTAPRALNRRTWAYRLRPSVTHKPYTPLPQDMLRSTPFDEVPTPPNQLRWDPIAVPKEATDFVDGLITIAGNGDSSMHSGVAIHLYVANKSMVDRAFYNADGELLIVPQMGALLIHTEFGRIDLKPGEICVIQRGIKFRVELLEKQARGYICENYGGLFRLPDLGPIGANGLANPRDFQTPYAAYEDREGDFRVAAKFLGRLWEAQYDHSPLDIVAWHGTYAPYKYDLARFNAMNTVSYDHPDPSIYCVLAAPSAIPGTANIEFALIGDRWTVARNTFRPPPFHRNVASEFVGLVKGRYIGKGDAFAPGCASLHNCMAGHGPDSESFERGSAAGEDPQYLENTMTIILETQLVIRPTAFAMETDLRERDYYLHWQGLGRRFDPK
jgi:homogentisate 1,2-dioxygenase